MRFWMFLALAFVVLLSSCQIFFLAGVYEELQDRGIASGGTKNIPNTSSSIVYIYVSGNGNDANDGLSPSKPVRTLVKAMEIANTMDKAANVVIKVGSGVYTPGSGLSSSGSGFVIDRPNIVISGGWNNDFSSVVGKSELDGNNSLYHVVMIKDVTNVKLENLVIRGGNASGSYPNDSGGGIYVSKVSYLVVESNVVVSNNSAYWGGGGVYLWYSANTTIGGSVYSNSAKYGGGLYLDNSAYNTISGSVYGNSAIYDGGGVYLWYSTNNTINGSVYSNNADWGGGVYLWKSTNNTISGSVYGNSANLGGGVFLWSSDYFTNTGWITNNNAGISGGGVYKFGSYYSYFGNVSGNSPDDIAP